MAKTEGYAKLSELQLQYPQLSIYRRFGALNARNLLYLQAEITDLEERLQRQTLLDINSTEGTRKEYSRNWFDLSVSKLRDGADEQWRLALCVREKLKEYNEALFQQEKLLALHGPHNLDLKVLNSWLLEPTGGNCAFTGLDRNTWSSTAPSDLLCLSPGSDDSLAQWLTTHALGIYHSLVGSRIKPPTDLENGWYQYDERVVVRTANLVGTLIASALPVVAVVVLVFVKDLLARLGMIALFTVVFSVLLVLVTKARRIEIAACCAAFASVQVIFVGGITT